MQCFGDDDGEKAKVGSGKEMLVEFEVGQDEDVKEEVETLCILLFIIEEGRFIEF